MVDVQFGLRQPGDEGVHVPGAGRGVRGGTGGRAGNGGAGGCCGCVEAVGHGVLPGTAPRPGGPDGTRVIG